jgi:chemotaxis protein CheD
MDFRIKPIMHDAVLPIDFTPCIVGAADDKHAKHYLMPGKTFASAEPFVVTTIVGSSVAVCLWDQENQIGGVNHFLLPEAPDEEESSARYADTANETLLSQMLALGANFYHLEAKIFGGSEPAITFGNSIECLGARNVKAAVRFLDVKGIRLSTKQVGGKSGRKLVFQTDDGQVWSYQI